MADKTPFETAREALMRLTARKLPPTPVNYQSVYNEIAGTPNVTAFPDEALRAVARTLPARTSFQKQQKEALERAVGQASWEAVQRVFVGYASLDEPKIDPAGFPVSATAELREQIARVVENALPALDADDARFSQQAAVLIKTLRDPSADRTKLKTALTEFSHRLSFAAEDQAEIRSTLLKLLHLIIQNIGEISMDDGWLKRQLDALSTSATPPLTLRRLDDLERRLHDVMRKQIDAKGRTLEAQDEMRKMLATFIERLAQMTESTSSFHSNMEHSAKLLEQAKTMDEVSPVLRSVIGATRLIASEVKATRDELREMREKVSASEAQIVKLHEELNAATAQARHDALTGALNRKGLDEAMTRELADVRRKEVPLCVALLDIDNFKKLNDSKGHDAGDAALNHLVAVTRECMRGQDTLARYGGEEFVILMPDTTMENGIEAMMRLQRALTRQYFLAGNEQILITFSAGVAQFEADETPESAIKRADQAMYLAKRQGRNRVLGA